MLSALRMAELRTESHGEVLWISGIDRLTSDNHKWFRELVLTTLRPEHTTVSVDLSRAVSLDSEGLGALISVYKRLRERNGTLRLVRPLPLVREMIQLLHFERLFEVTD
mgnify:CR=1 FL=1